MVVVMKVDQVSAEQQSRFKIVCIDCGSLTIQTMDPVNSPETTQVLCGRCGAVRGTLRDLHLLARRGDRSFEF